MNLVGKICDLSVTQPEGGFHSGSIRVHYFDPDLVPVELAKSVRHWWNTCAEVVEVAPVRAVVLGNKVVHCMKLKIVFLLHLLMSND